MNSLNYIIKAVLWLKGNVSLVFRNRVTESPECYMVRIHNFDNIQLRVMDNIL